MVVRTNEKGRDGCRPGRTGASSCVDWTLWLGTRKRMTKGEESTRGDLSTFRGRNKKREWVSAALKAVVISQTTLGLWASIGRRESRVQICKWDGQEARLDRFCGRCETKGTVQPGYETRCIQKVKRRRRDKAREENKGVRYSRTLRMHFRGRSKTHGTSDKSVVRHPGFCGVRKFGARACTLIGIREAEDPVHSAENWGMGIGAKNETPPVLRRPGDQSSEPATTCPIARVLAPRSPLLFQRY